MSLEEPQDTVHETGLDDGMLSEPDQSDVKAWLLQNQVKFLVEQVTETKELFQKDMNRLRNQLGMQDQKHETVLDRTAGLWRNRQEVLDAKVDQLMNLLVNNKDEKLRDLALEASRTTNETLAEKVAELESLVQEQLREIAALKENQSKLRLEMDEKSKNKLEQTEQLQSLILGQSAMLKSFQEGFEEIERVHSEEVQMLKNRIDVNNTMFLQIQSTHKQQTEEYAAAKDELKAAKELLKQVKAENTFVHDDLVQLKSDWENLANEHKIEMDYKMSKLATDVNELLASKKILDQERLAQNASNEKMGKVVLDLATQFEQIQDQVIRYTDDMLTSNDAMRNEQSERQRNNERLRQEMNEVLVKMNHMQVYIDACEDEIHKLSREVKDNKSALVVDVGGDVNKSYSMSSPRRLKKGSSFSPRMVDETSGPEQDDRCPSMQREFQEMGRDDGKRDDVVEEVPIIESPGLFRSSEKSKKMHPYVQPEELKVLDTENSKLERLMKMVQCQSNTSYVLPLSSMSRTRSIDIEVISNALHMRITAVDNIKDRLEELSRLLLVTKDDLKSKNSYEEDSDDENENDTGRQIQKWRILSADIKKKVSLLEAELDTTKNLALNNNKSGNDTMVGECLSLSPSLSIQQRSEVEQQIQLWVAQAESLDCKVKQQLEEVGLMKNQLFESREVCNDIWQSEEDAITVRRSEWDLLLEHTQIQSTKLDHTLLDLSERDYDSIRDLHCIYAEFEGLRREITDAEKQVREARQELLALRDRRVAVHRNSENRIKERISQIEQIEEQYHTQAKEIQHLLEEYTKFQDEMNNPSKKASTGHGTIKDCNDGHVIDEVNTISNHIISEEENEDNMEKISSSDVRDEVHEKNISASHSSGNDHDEEVIECSDAVEMTYSNAVREVTSMKSEVSIEQNTTDVSGDDLEEAQSETENGAVDVLMKFVGNDSVQQDENEVVIDSKFDDADVVEGSCTDDVETKELDNDQIEEKEDAQNDALINPEDENNLIKEVAQCSKEQIRHNQTGEKVHEYDSNEDEQNDEYEGCYDDDDEYEEEDAEEVGDEFEVENEHHSRCSSNKKQYSHSSTKMKSEEGSGAISYTDRDAESSTSNERSDSVVSRDTFYTAFYDAVDREY